MQLPKYLGVESLREGWRVEVTRGGRLRALSPDKRTVVVFAVQPHTRCAARNAIAALRRAGALPRSE